MYDKAEPFSDSFPSVLNRTRITGLSPISVIDTLPSQSETISSCEGVLTWPEEEVDPTVFSLAFSKRAASRCDP